jgi:hypothetical protein
MADQVTKARALNERPGERDEHQIDRATALGIEVPRVTSGQERA